MIKGVIFDMDGVLVDSEYFYEQRRREFFRRMDFIPEYQGDFIGSNEPEMWRILVPDDSEFREQMMQGYRAYRRLHPTPYGELLDPAVPELFRCLKARGIRIGIASSSPKETVRHLMALAGVETLVDNILTGEECAAYKPAPDIYLRSMEAMDLSPETSFAVEDSPAGIRAAVDAGMRVYALRPRHGEKLDQSSAHGVLRSLDEVLTKI